MPKPSTFNKPNPAMTAHILLQKLGLAFRQITLGFQVAELKPAALLYYSSNETGVSSKVRPKNNRPCPSK